MNSKKSEGKAKRTKKWDTRLAKNNGTLDGGKEKASPLSKLMFSWIGQLVGLAYDRPLEPEHLFPLPSTSKTPELVARFNEAWGLQLAKPPGQRSLARAMVKVFRKTLIFSGVLAMMQQLVLLAVPLIVQQLLQWFLDGDDGIGVGIAWAGALFLVGFCGNGLLSNHYFLALYVLGMDARTMLNSVTYSKSLRLSNKSRQSTSTGELVTLMSNDAQRLPDMSLSVHTIWSTPIFVALAIFFLVRLVGVSALAGIVFLLAMIPIQGRLAMKQMGLQRAQMKQTESRVKVVNEVLQGIRIVKYYAWEAPFIERISSLRDKEVSTIKNFAFVNAYSMSIMLTTPFVMVMLTLVVYFNGSGDFGPDVVFTAVSLLLVIRFPLMMLPMAIASWVQGKVSLGRMQKFFELEELHPSDREWTNRNGNGKGAGTLSASGTYVWTPEVDKDEKAEDAVEGANEDNPGEMDIESGEKKRAKATTVMDAGEGVAKDKNPKEPAQTGGLISGEAGDIKTNGDGGDSKEQAEIWQLHLEGLEIPAGKLVAVVGQVGSGKSSLVSALLGEMTKLDGHVSVDGSVAYVAQSAWIINATLKENILMGRPYEKQRYETVLNVCDMRQDLAQLPAGDMTEIGEKGINLSGGQKQRVSIARAAYADADVYILDDPLSAVDAHVARHLFDKCLAGFLKGKTIVLCANQLQFLSQTDRVLVLSDGRLSEEGPYSELMATPGSGLARLMETFAEGDSDVEEELYGHEERKSGEDESVRFVPHESIVPVSAGSSRHGGHRASRTSSGRVGEASLSVDAWSRSVREASDTTVVMMESWAGPSPVPSASASHPDGVLVNSLHGGSSNGDDFTQGGEGDRAVKGNSGAGEAGDPSLGIMGHPSVKRRRSRTASQRSALRQRSDGGSSVAGGDESQPARPRGDGTLQTVEMREEGAVELRVFRIYFKDGAGGWGLPVVLILVSILTQACSNAFDVWLSYWSNEYFDGDTAAWYQYVYAALCVALVSLYLARALLFAWQAVKSSRHLHGVLCRGVMRAPVSFFDTTPIGRVLNRFTKDMDSIDLLLPRNVPQFVSTLSVLIGVLVTIIVVLPWFVLVIVPIMVAYYMVQMYYRPVNRDLQRLESVSRSPIFAQFSETLNGVSTVRAYNQQEEFIERNSSRLDDSSTAFYHMHVSNRWLGVRLEAMGTTMNLAAALFIVFSRDSSHLSIQEGIAGLLLTYTQQITGYLTWAVRMGCETEARITAVERAQEYADLVSEAPPIVDDYRPPKGWPAQGALQLSGIQMRYRPGLDLVLKGVDLNIKGGERIGIAGRTGSGKSSLMVTLFRIVEPCGGNITIDGVDALKVGLQDLREAISIIPQDPVMFGGTIRDNLDPFGHSDDVTIWAALEASRLSQYVSGLDGKLDAEVSEGGENLSLGQRQLVCLARAVLRRNKILVMDEATANVDVDTDSLIQEAIRREFADCTVLTIAHRLNTIMDSDRILVMKDGKVGEFDTPANLVADESSLLMGFIRQTGAGSSRRLVGIATGAVGGADNTSHTATTESSASGTPPSSPRGEPVTSSLAVPEGGVSPAVMTPRPADGVAGLSDSGATPPPVVAGEGGVQPETLFDLGLLSTDPSE